MGTSVTGIGYEVDCKTQQTLVYNVVRKPVIAAAPSQAGKTASRTAERLAQKVGQQLVQQLTGARFIANIALMDSTRCPIRLRPMKPQHFRTGVYAKPFSDSGCQVADRPQAEQGHTKTRTLF